VLKRPLYRYVAPRFANNDRQLRLTIEFARQNLIVANTFSGTDNAVRSFDKELGLFPAHRRAGFFLVMFVVVAAGAKLSLMEASAQRAWHAQADEARVLDAARLNVTPT
jgi:hypothetical protein